MEINSVSIGIDEATNLPIHRKQLYHRASTKEDVIEVFYNEFLVANGVEVSPFRKCEYYYQVKDIPETEETPAFNGFTDWVNFIPEQGVTMGTIIINSIDLQLQAIPLDAENGYLITK